MLELYTNMLNITLNNCISMDDRTKYYEKHKNILNAYDAYIFNVGKNNNLDDNIEIIRKESTKLGIKSTYSFFRHHRKSVCDVGYRILLDKKLGMKESDDYLDIFDINRFNFERIIKCCGVSSLNINSILKAPDTPVDIRKISTERFAYWFNGVNNKGRKVVSSIILVKHESSIEFYDFKELKTVAFKNYNTGTTFGDWNSDYESLAMRVINYVRIINNRAKINEELRKYASQDTINKMKEAYKGVGGAYLSPYKVAIFKMTARLLVNEDIINEYTITKCIVSAIKKLSASNENIKEAYELDVLTSEIKKIEIQEERERQEKLRLGQEEKQRLKEERRKQIELDKYGYTIVTSYQRKYIEEWGNYEEEHHRLVSGIGYNIHIPGISKDTNNSRRISHVIMNNDVIKMLNITNFKDKAKLSALGKIIKFSSKRIDKSKLNEFISKLDKEGLEAYLHDIIGESFVRLVDRKELDAELSDDKELVIIYEKIRETVATNGRIGKTSLVHNKGKERGQLIVYGNKVIDGGDNKKNQCTFELKITNEALNDLCMLIGKVNPNSSELNSYVENNILYAKSQRPDVFSINEHAVITYLTNRDRDDFSNLKDFDSSRKKVNIYIPCEYNAYIKALFAYNESNKLIKRNYTAIFNMIVYEHLMIMFNKSYKIN